MTEKHIVYLGLGSNLGDGRKQLEQALDLLQEQAGVILFTSTLIESEPWGFVSTHRFTNAVTVIATQLSADTLLDVTQEIERQMGRVHKSSAREGYSDRTIDIDLLLYDDLQMQTERLTLPHPHIQERPFVYEPLKECQAYMLKHPVRTQQQQ